MWKWTFTSRPSSRNPVTKPTITYVALVPKNKSLWSPDRHHLYRIYATNRIKHSHFECQNMPRKIQTANNLLSVQHESAGKMMALTPFTFLGNARNVHAVIHWTAFCIAIVANFCVEMCFFPETEFYCGFVGIIFLTIRSINFWKWSHNKINYTTRTEKKSSSHKYHFHIQNRPKDHTSFEMQRPFFIAESASKINSAKSVWPVSVSANYSQIYALVFGGRKIYASFIALVLVKL